MGELVDNFENFEKKLKDNREFKQRERIRKKEAFKSEATSTTITLGPPSEEYRQGWERIFGNKSGDKISGESSEVAQD